VALLALLLAAAPVSAHHGKGSHARDPDADDGANIEKQGGFSTCDWQSNPNSCPGNSGWAHWCKEQHGPGRSRGQCIAQHAREQGVELDRDDDSDHGDLRITEFTVFEGGFFRVRGEGATGSVLVSIGGGSGDVVGFGQGTADPGGLFDFGGQWACQDDATRRARVRVQDDTNDRDSEMATFSCDKQG
jgi:hypothetical protein